MATQLALQVLGQSWKSSRTNIRELWIGCRWLHVQLPEGFWQRQVGVNRMG